MPAEEALVSVRGTASHTGQPTPVHPAFVVLLVRDRVVGQRLTAAFRPMPTHVVYCVSELHAVMTQHRGAVACVVAEARDSAHEPVGPALSALIQRFPTVPVLGYCGAGARHAADLRDLARAGVHELVFADVDDHPALLRTKLARSEEACAAAAVLRGINGLLPPVLSRLAEYCVHFPRDSHEISRIAAALGVHRKTLVNWCERAKIPPPSTLVTWVRLLLAAELLRSPGQAVERVANTLEFASPTAFRNQCRRYLGMRPSELRTAEGREAAYRGFAEALTEARRIESRERTGVEHRSIPVRADAAPAHSPQL
jgi:AraC-like DNA-binding protein